MPIVIGFEACRQIIAAYDDKKNNQKNNCHRAILDDLFLEPLMIAYSGYVDEAI